MLTKQKILDELKEKKLVKTFAVKTRHSKNPDKYEYAYDKEEAEKRYAPNGLISHNPGERQLL